MWQIPQQAYTAKYANYRVGHAVQHAKPAMAHVGQLNHGKSVQHSVANQRSYVVPTRLVASQPSQSMTGRHSSQYYHMKPAGNGNHVGQMIHVVPPAHNTAGNHGHTHNQAGHMNQGVHVNPPMNHGHPSSQVMHVRPSNPGHTQVSHVNQGAHVKPVHPVNPPSMNNGHTHSQGIHANPPVNHGHVHMDHGIYVTPVHYVNPPMNHGHIQGGTHIAQSNHISPAVYETYTRNAYMH